jgi:hypothetical protein
MTNKKNIQPEENPKPDNEKQNTLVVKIISNVSLLQILDDKKRLLRSIVVLFAIVIFIFIGLAIATIIIKRFYPYNEIKINMYGATIMQNEETEVIYWLFNTADLWANSGIQVKKGDRLTIRASGKFHTAIHHLVEDVKNNNKLSDKWVGTDGEVTTPIVDTTMPNKNKLRANFRIFPNEPQGALLLQVVPNDKEQYLSNADTAEKFRNERDRYLVFNNMEYDKKVGTFDNKAISKTNNRSEDFYFIGKERTDLLIYCDGVLHFAVNDIVLTDSIIKYMIDANNKKINEDKTYNGTNWDSLNKKNFAFGPYPDPVQTLTEAQNEMTFYQKTHYYNAWFDDNVGSFLIVIERKKSK